MRPSGLLIVWLVAALAGPTRAQRFDGRVYTEADGLPHQAASSAAQSSDGLLWFGTRAGPISYDTAKWRRSEAFADSPRPRASVMLAGVDGEVWAFECAPPFRGRRRLTDGTWRSLPDNPIATRGGAVINLAVARAGDTTVALLGTRDDDLFALRDGTWTRIEGERGSMRAITADDGRLLIAHDLGLEVLEVTTAELRPREVPGVPSRPLALARDDALDQTWVVGGTWIGALRDDGFHLVRDDTPYLLYPEVLRVAALPDRRGGLHFGERSGCFHLRRDGTVIACSRDDPITAIGLTAMMRDREGVVWATGVRGIARLGGRDVCNWSAADGLLADEVTALLELRDGSIVAGHEEGLTFLDEPPRTLRLPPNGLYSRIMSMVEDDAGRIVAAANQYGLVRIDPADLSIERIPIPHEEMTVQFVARAGSGDVFVGCWHNVYRLRGDAVEALPLGEFDESNDFVRHVTCAGDAVYVTMRSRGLLRLRDGELRSWRGATPSQNNATCASPRPGGEVWVGAAAGLLRTTAEGALVHVDLLGERIETPVYSICDDRRGRTWLGTNRGVVVWDGERLARLGAGAGLIGRETNRGANLCDRRGRMWIGFDRGLAMFADDYELADGAGPSVAFLQPTIDGALQEQPWSAVPANSSATFRLRTISSRDEEHLLHSYRIEPVTDGWSEPAPLPRRELTYHALAPGRYRLHVRVTDSLGASDEAASPWLEILPPWWQRPTFVTGAALFALLLVGGCGALLAWRRQARALERVVADRTTALRDERNRLQAMLTNLTEGVVGVDARGVVTMWNPTAAAQTGWSAASAIGRPLAELLPPLAACLRERTQSMRDPVAIRVEGGAVRRFEYSAAPAGDGQIVVLRDVTERLEQERLLGRTERLESLGVLAGGIAHDFNNLLTVVLGNLSLLEAPDDAADAATMRGQMRDALLRARDLTRQLLTFSKGGAPVRSVDSLRDTLAESCQLALSGSNVRLALAVADDLRPVSYDPGQLSQVFHNLVLNARQAMPRGGTVHVRAANDAAPPEGVAAPAVVVEVRDEGEGIGPADLERIFDPYYSTKPRGTGLGLATSHSIVKRHDGALTVRSTPGAGATFRVHLPAAHADVAVAAAAQPHVTPTGGAAARRLRLLCMDDDEAVRSVLAATLRRAGHDVSVVADGRDAVEAYRAARLAGRPFDLVVLDLTVPGGMGGVAALTALRAVDADVAAVAATGYSTEPVVADFARHGFRAVLTKPFTATDVLDAVASARAADDRERPA